MNPPKIHINLEEYGDDEIYVSWTITRGDKVVETHGFKNDLYQDGEVFLPAISACIDGSLEELLEALAAEDEPDNRRREAVEATKAKHDG